MYNIENLKKRVKKLPAEEISSLMNFNINDISFGMKSEARTILNNKIIKKFESGDIDEIELIIIESGL